MLFFTFVKQLIIEYPVLYDLMKLSTGCLTADRNLWFIVNI